MTLAASVSWWRWLRTALVVLFVVWHLFFLLFQNLVALWREEILSILPEPHPGFDRVEEAAYWYGSALGISQGWRLFAPPLASQTWFLAVRLEFEDGSLETLTSETIPDPTSFLRLGGWRQQKLEDRLCYPQQDMLSASENGLLLRAYLRWSVRRWRHYHPDDLRRLARLTLLRRTVSFRAPDEDPHAPPQVREEVLGSFTPEGWRQ
jgi:hypothetical protein